jgi:hypothetical protein
MAHIIENLIASLWNRTVSDASGSAKVPGLDLGALVRDGQTSRARAVIPHSKRAEHLAVLGKTGTGKSSLLRYLSLQDIRSDRGFFHFDLHGDTTPWLLGLLAAEEQKRNCDLSDRVILVEPADPEYSIGLNVLEHKGDQESFVQIAEFAHILKQRWHLDSFGARTEELLRNALLLLSDNNLTLLELAPLLINAAFRASCLKRSRNQDVRAFFETRYDLATVAMQTIFRDAILNKVSGFTADPRFRHILGQTQSSFSLTDALDGGFWVILNLNKGRLGEQATTLGSLFLTKLKNALFARQSRTLFTLYCDELQNLIAYDSGLDTLLSEARKFGISVCSANQFLDQYPQQMRSAILAVGTHVLFQLSSIDAERMAAALDGGKRLAEILKNLPQRHFVFKSGHHQWRQAVVPKVTETMSDWTGLYNRCRTRWARKRGEIEKEIRERQGLATRSSNEVLRDWE